MAGEPRDVRLTVRRGAYRTAFVLAVLALLGLGAGIRAAPALAVLLPPVAAYAVCVLVAARRALAGPAALVVDAEGVHAGALTIAFADGAQVLATSQGELRAVLSADGSRVLRVPRWVEGVPAYFAARVIAGLKAALPTAYAASAARLAARRLHPPGLLDEVRAAHGETPGAMLFARAPRRRGAVQGATMRLAALVMLGAGMAAAALVPEGLRPMPILCCVLGATWLLSAALASFPDSASRWLLLHRDGLALITRRLSGEMAWDEIAEITHAVPGPLGAIPTDRALPSLLRVTATDHTRLPLPDAFDAPLASIAAAMLAFRHPPVAEAEPVAAPAAVAEQTDRVVLAELLAASAAPDASLAPPAAPDEPSAAVAHAEPAVPEAIATPAAVVEPTAPAAPPGQPASTAAPLAALAPIPTDPPPTGA